MTTIEDKENLLLPFHSLLNIHNCILIYIYNYLGWALTVELLSTAFQSGPFGEDVCGIDRSTGKPTPMPLGHYFLAIDIEKLCPLDTFKANASNLLHAVRSSKKSPQGCGKP